MTIKEVEKLVELKKANIRYYEEEGLLTPKRNTQNNYRDYEAADVEILKKIKCLRLLGVSVEDIRKLQQKQITLAALMQKRKESLNREAQEIELIKNLCGQLEQKKCSFEELDTSLLDMRSSFFLMKGETIMKMDRIYQMEKYYMIFMRTWQTLFLIYMPAMLALKYVLNKELPWWITAPFVTISLIAAVLAGYTKNRMAHYKQLSDSTDMPG